MKRRHLLAASLPAALAGCLINSSTRSTPKVGGESTSPIRTDSGPTATPVENDPPTYKPSGSRSKDFEGEPFVQARIATMPKPVPFHPWIELIRQPARDTVGKLEIGMTNRTTQPWTISGGSSNPFSGGDSDAGIWVGSSASEIEDGCPRGAPVTKGIEVYDQVLSRQSISTTYQLSATHDKDVCFPSGDHRFPGHRLVYESRDDEDPALAFEWWFTLIAE